MGSYRNANDLAVKADSEGGLEAMIWGYGLSVKDLPPDAPHEVVEALKRLTTSAAEDLETLRAWLPDPDWSEFG